MRNTKTISIDDDIEIPGVDVQDLKLWMKLWLHKLRLMISTFLKMTQIQLR
jgi:hypothetical protein